MLYSKKMAVSQETTINNNNYINAEQSTSLYERKQPLIPGKTSLPLSHIRCCLFVVKIASCIIIIKIVNTGLHTAHLKNIISVQRYNFFPQYKNANKEIKQFICFYFSFFYYLISVGG